jgi:hypothetical protein
MANLAPEHLVGTTTDNVVIYTGHVIRFTYQQQKPDSSHLARQLPFKPLARPQQVLRLFARIDPLPAIHPAAALQHSHLAFTRFIIEPNEVTILRQRLGAIVVVVGHAHLRSDTHQPFAITELRVANQV